MRRTTFFTLMLTLFFVHVPLTHAQYPRLPDKSVILSQAPDGETYLAETEAGVIFLYDVVNRQRIDFSGEVVTYLASVNMKPRRHVRSLELDVVWGRGEKTNAVFLTLAGVGHAVTRFNVRTGQQTGYYASGLEGVTVHFKLHDGMMVTYDPQSQRGRIHALSGDLTQDFSTAAPAGYAGIHQQFFTDDNRYFVVMSQINNLPVFEVWDTTARLPYSGQSNFSLSTNGMIAYERVVGLGDVNAEEPSALIGFYVGGRLALTADLNTRQVQNWEADSTTEGESAKTAPEVNYTPSPHMVCAYQHSVLVSATQMDITTDDGAIFVWQDNLSQPDYVLFSPNCRYVAVTQFDAKRVGIYVQTYVTTIYSTVSREIVAQFPHTYRGWILSWSPDGRYVWWASDTEATLLETRTATQHTINPSAEGRGLWLKDSHLVRWDMAGGLVTAEFDWGSFSINLADGSRR